MDYKEKYTFYDGSKSIEELLEIIESLGMQKSKCYFVCFKGMYYAIFFDSTSREMVIGSPAALAFYSRNNRLEAEYVESLPFNYEIKTRTKTDTITKTLAEELNQIDPNLRVYGFPTLKSKEVKDVTEELKISKYVVLLALTFCSKYYTLNDFEEMSRYFVAAKELCKFLSSTKGAIKVDPFKQIVLYEDGSKGGYSITYYYDVRSGETKKTFALVDINPYTEDSKKRRKWLSLTQYKNMYPNDFIDYPKPDFRVNKGICKWCGSALPAGKLSFCSDACSSVFAKATSIRQGDLLGYKILCRDNFICQHCFKDLAVINEYGMKIPTSKLSNVPDLNGEFRRMAQVHHCNVRVADGGSDHQENLITVCDDCHLLLEGKERNVKL